MHPTPFIGYQISCEYLEWIHEEIAKNCEVLKSARPDTFAGRKTQEPFPQEPFPQEPFSQELFSNANFSYRSLELLCRQQAKLSAKTEARNELERMALEYKRLADWQEHQWPELDEQGRHSRARLVGR